MSEPEQSVAELKREIERLRAELRRQTGAFRPIPDLASVWVEVERVSQMGTWVWDLSTQNVRWSPQLYRILGVDPATHAASVEAFFAALHLDDVERVQAASARGVETGDSVPVNFRVRWADGTVRECAMDGVSIRDETGRPVQFVGTVLDLTERNVAEAQIRRREFLLAEAQHIANVGSWTCRVGGARVEWSPQLFRIFGLPTDTAPTSELFFDLVHPEDVARVREASARASQIGRHSPIDFRIVRRNDGELRHVRMAWQAITDDAGAITDFIGTIIDITEQVQTATALRKSEARWRAIAENPFDYVSVVDAEGRFEYVNRPEAELPGWQNATIYEFMQPESREMVREKMARVFATGEPDSYEVFSPQSGRWFFTVVGPIRRDGRTVSASLLSRDVTDQKLAEEKLTHSERMLREAQRIAGLGCWTCDFPSGRIEGSEEMYRLLGLPVDAPITTESIAATIHPQDLPRIEEAAEIAAQTGVFEPQHCRVRRASDGEWRDVQTSGEALRDAQGTIIGFIGTTWDITARRRLEDQLLHSQKLEAVGRLAGGVAHDFNNMLTAIVGNAQLAAEALPEASPIRERIDEVLAAADRAATLTRQLLAFARKQVIQPIVANPRDLIGGLEKLLRPLLGEDVRIAVQLPDDLWRIRIDRGQFEQLVVNLAVNARDAMPDGGQFSIAAQNLSLDAEFCRNRPEVVPGDYVQITMADTGVGMDDEVRQHAFEPFFTTKEPGKGTGLGLPMCHGIVTQNDGHIWFDSEPGGGTRFTILFRRARATPSQPAIAPPSPAVGGGKETILVVEDEDIVRGLCVRVLRSVGYRVLEAASGSEALKVAGEWPGDIDLLLTDVILTDTRGPQVAQWLRDLRPTIRVMFTSGYTENASLDESDRTRAIGFLPKPYTPDTLTASVHDALSATLPTP